MNITKTAVVTVLLIICLVARADQVRIDEFKARLAEKIELALQEDPRDLLVKNGLSETDANRVF